MKFFGRNISIITVMLRVSFVGLIIFAVISCNKEDMSDDRLNGIIQDKLHECMEGEKTANLDPLYELRAKYKNNARIEASIATCIGFVDVYKKTKGIKDYSKVDDVEMHFLFAVEIEPYNYEYQIALGLLYEAAQRYQKAVDILQPLFVGDLIAVDSKSRIVSVNLANCLYKVGDKKRAIELLKKSISKNTYDKTLTVVSLNWLIETGEYSEAELLADEYISWHNNKPDLFDRCTNLLRHGEANEASTCYDENIR